MPSETSKPFKSCPMCNYQWATMEIFVRDLSLNVNGYQACFDRAEDGLFLLTHICPQCHSTLAVKAEEFLDWKPCHVSEHLNALQDTCPRHCTDKNNLEPCSAECSMRWVREVLQYLKAHETPAVVQKLSPVTTD